MPVLGPYIVAASQVTSPVREGSGVTLMARIVGAAAAEIEHADVTDITQEIWRILPPPALRLGNWRDKYIDPVQPQRIGTPDPLTVANVVFDTLQTAAPWSIDTSGYNFRVDLPETAFGTLDKNTFPRSQWIHVEFEFTPDSGAKFRLPLELELLASLFGKG